MCTFFHQVSWSLPHKQATSGTYQVKFFDEESYSALRKVSVLCVVDQLTVSFAWAPLVLKWVVFIIKYALISIKSVNLICFRPRETMKT